MDEFLKNNCIWIETPLHDFCYKCIAGRHGSCKGCGCLCHHLEILQENSPESLEVTWDEIWKLWKLFLCV